LLSIIGGICSSFQVNPNDPCSTVCYPASASNPPSGPLLIVCVVGCGGSCTKECALSSKTEKWIPEKRRKVPLCLRQLRKRDYEVTNNPNRLAPKPVV